MNEYDCIARRRRLRMAASLAVVLAAFALACGGGDKATGPDTSIAGNYTLRTVNGANLPAVVFRARR